MQIVRGRDADAPSAKRMAADHVTGTSWNDPVLSGPDGTAIGHVFFEPGARTHWHTHANGQILQVTSGRGVIRARDGSGGVIAVGDTVLIPAGEEHWHGAAPDSYLVHISITREAPDWLEEVSEEDYARG
jgi:quercetin dioxygenase-like cupin family protein